MVDCGYILLFSEFPGIDTISNDAVIYPHKLFVFFDTTFADVGFIFRSSRGSMELIKKTLEPLSRFLLYVNALSHSLSITVTQISFLLAFPYLVAKAFRRELHRNVPLLIPFGLWIGWIVLGSFFISDYVRPLKQMLSWWHVLFFLFSYFAVRLGEDALRLCAFAIVGSLAQSLYGIFQFVLSGADRALGVSSNALTYSNGLALTAVGIVSWLLFNQNMSSKQRFTLTVAGTTIVIGVFCSLSRMVIYGMLLVIGALVILRYRLKGLLVLSTLVVFLFALTFHNPRFERLYNRGYTVIISDSTRLVLWKSAVAMIKDHPVFGIGVHVFPKLIDQYAKGFPLDAKGHAHNAYLQAAINYGLPGLFLLLAVYVALALRLFQNFRRTGSIWAFAGLTILAMYMLEGLTEDNFGDAEVAMYFWFLQGLILGQIVENDEKSVSRTANSLP